MNKDGYFITEKVEEWVDVPAEEKENRQMKKETMVKPMKKKQKVVNTKGLKQGSLTSFFQKK